MHRMLTLLHKYKHAACTGRVQGSSTLMKYVVLHGSFSKVYIS